MKRRILIIVFLISLGSSVKCQDWLSINPIGISYFKVPYNSDYLYKAIRIDSMLSYRDTTEYYSYKMLRGTIRMTANGDSWIGEKLMILPNGWNLFFNYRKDTIKINTFAKINESWIMYIFPNKDYIKAKVQTNDTMSFLGKTDSVKVIGLSLKDESGNDIISNFDSLELKLSKRYGLIQIPEFYVFPFDGPGSFPPSSRFTYSLAGMSNPKFGYQNITADDIFRYEINDELHWGYDHALGTLGSWTERYIDKIVDKRTINDSIIYSIDRCFQIIETKNDSSTTDTGHIEFEEVVDFVSSQYKRFNYLPYEPCKLDKKGAYHKIEYCIVEANDNCKQAYSYYCFRGDHPDSLVYTIYDPDCLSKGFKGIGYGYTICPGMHPGSFGNKYPIYYNNRFGEFGTKLNCNSLLYGIDNKENQMRKFTFYPNPAEDIITIKSFQKNSKLQLSIIDLHGKLYFSEIVNSNKEIKIDILPKGVYIVNIMADKVQINKRLIKL